MYIEERIKTVRTAKNLCQKEVTIALDMDQAQFSCLESGKTERSLSNIEKIAKGIGVYLSEGLYLKEIFRDINTYYKTLMEKVCKIEQQDEIAKNAFFAI